MDASYRPGNKPPFVASNAAALASCIRDDLRAIVKILGGLEASDLGLHAGIERAKGVANRGLTLADHLVEMTGSASHPSRL